MVKMLEHLGGSVSWASDFSSSHGLMVREFEPHIGLAACLHRARVGSSVSLSLSLSNTNILKNGQTVQFYAIYILSPRKISLFKKWSEWQILCYIYLTTIKG